MADDDCWGAFGSDSDSDDDGEASKDGSSPPDDDDDRRTDSFESAADATSLAITRHFASSAKSSGVSLRERVVGIAARRDGTGEFRRSVMEKRIGGRGMKAAEAAERTAAGALFSCDAAILLSDDDGAEGGRDVRSSRVRRALLPGGFLHLVISLGGDDDGDDGSARKRLADYYSEAVWDVDSASVIHSSSDFRVISMRKRPCVVNAWSCPWMDKRRRIGRPSSETIEEEDGEFRIREDDTYLRYERRVAGAVTIAPGVAERARGRIDDDGTTTTTTRATVLTDANVARAASVLREHGLVVIRGLLPRSQTLPWGDAVLSDFASAAERLRRHPTRPVDLTDPRGGATGADGERRAFEPLSYKEMAMREDLRVDLRSGPEMEALRREQNSSAFDSMGGDADDAPGDDTNGGPTVVRADCAGTVASWRFHPSILAIAKATFNPRDDSLFEGNFGRWNFGGAGPDGSPQPFRLGQVGSVLSCPGAGDQAIHADTPHLFEHVDCLPCHYLNVFTPGYDATKANDPDDDCCRNEFDDDGIWTGNSTMGGTAFVHGSHKLSATAKLLSEDDEVGTDADEDENGDGAGFRRRLLQLRTLRPALEAGDVVLFDCRTIHYGLANTSKGDATGKNADAGRRPMLYLNVSQSWFHDPKNWDDRERIFD